MIEQSRQDFTIHDLAELFQLQDSETFEEQNSSYPAEAYTSAYWEARQAHRRESRAERLALRAETAALHHLYDLWRTAVEEAARYTLEKVYLDLDEVRKRGKRSHRLYNVFRIRPAPGHTWREAYKAISMIIEGYSGIAANEGSSYPSYKQAVLVHLGWVRHYGDAYGDKRPDDLYEDAISDYSRCYL